LGARVRAQGQEKGGKKGCKLRPFTKRFAASLGRKEETSSEGQRKRDGGPVRGRRESLDSSQGNGVEKPAGVIGKVSKNRTPLLAGNSRREVVCLKDLAKSGAGPMRG